MHAKAQKDILTALEEYTSSAQVIFSTHSPYLIQPDKIHRIRLISKDQKNGTVILNKIHAFADKETLIPILTAIGLELNDGIQNINKLNNVIVEGLTDVFYLHAFSLLQKDKFNLNFIFGGGASKMGFVGTILMGWGCKVIYLYDNDQGKKSGEKELKTAWLVEDELINSVLEDKGAIEDIFSLKDFKKFILYNENLEYKSSNSKYVNKSKKYGDKVLLARLFLQEVEKQIPELDDATNKNIEELLNKLNKCFNN